MVCSMLGFPVHHQLPELAQTNVYWVSDAIQPSHPLLSPSSPTFNLSQHQGLFQWVSSSHRIAKVLLQYQSFQWTSRTDLFRMGWFDLLAVQGALKSLLQHHSSKASILWHLAFFIVQFSHPYMTIGKTIALNTWTFADKVMSLLFNMLSRLVIASLPRSKSQSSSAVILEPPEIKSFTGSIVSPSISHEVIGLDAMVFVFWMLSIKPAFSLAHFHQVALEFLFTFCHKGWCHLYIWGYWNISNLRYDGFSDSSGGKESTSSVGDLGLIPGLRKPPGGRKGYPL